MASEKWLSMLSNAKVEPNEYTSSGDITCVKVRQSDSSWRLCLLFDRVIPWDILKETLDKISANLIENYDVKKVLYTVSYRDESINNDYNLLFKYYQAGIDICKTKKATITSLFTFPSRLDGNKFIIEVPSVDDKKVVDEHLPLLNAFLVNYGFSKILLTTEINADEVSIKEVHHEQMVRTLDQNEAKSIEMYQKKKAEAQASEEHSTYTRPKSNQAITILLNEVPFTSIEVEEFKQTRFTNKVEVTGVVVKAEVKEIKTKDGREFNLFEGIITDYTDSVIIKRFYREADKNVFEKDIKPGKRLVIRGSIQWDDFAKDVVIMCDSIIVCGIDASRQRFDSAEEKRVELHAHTKMSVLDSILNVDEYVDQAVRYGHTALAVTDHANCHILPDFFKLCAEKNIKPIAGVEAYYVDDTALRITHPYSESIDLRTATYVIFDLETTGLSVNYNEIIEIGAVKLKDGLIIDTFMSFVKPKTQISTFISELTSITNMTVQDAPYIEEIFPDFLEFIKGAVLVAQNADFDTGFVYDTASKLGLSIPQYPCIDTLDLARTLYMGGPKNYKLETIAKYLKVEIEQQHRAIHDAKTTTNVFNRMLSDLFQKKVFDYQDLNGLINRDVLAKSKRPLHLCILVKNRVGLKNFYKILSDAHTTHFNKDALVYRSVLDKYREEILIGSGCANGDIFITAYERPYYELLEKAAYYDYLEVQPPACYYWMFENETEKNRDYIIQDVIKKIISAGHDLNIPVVATGDVHHLIEEDSKYRSIYLAVARPNGGGPHPLSKHKPLDMHFRSTTEMLDAFSFLPADLAHEIVVKNSNLISDMIESFPLFPKELYVPRDDFMQKIGVPSMKEAVHDISFATARAKYGEDLPLYVQERLERELNAIIGHGYASVYFISHLLVKNSNDAGYVVGSRGSVGSSFVATMMGITEVNALKPHYVCPHCHFHAFKLTKEEQERYHMPVSDEFLEKLRKVSVGFDLPDANCPVCGEKLEKNGIDIAFETFLGFKGDKVPDIDLNFSGEYQAKAHLFCQETFGFDNAFRAGTVSTVMDKTAFAYTRDYYSDRNIKIRKTEIERIASFIAGSKKTTGQHPGGIVVVPDTIEYTDIIPVQYPPVDSDEIDDLGWRTSHYDYHSFESNLLKLDILGHDDPTVIKQLMDFVHQEPNLFPFNTVEGIPFLDPDVLSLFSSKEALKINGDDMDKLSSGTRGMPEFGTQFVRGMLETIKPKTYADIIKVSGLSHGTDVWGRNAEELFKGINPLYPKVEFSELIGCRDDIMLYLMEKNLPAHDAFTIMEGVRKGKGLKKEQEELMLKYNVPDWYIYSCKRIKYMFPKAHATAYVIMALRIGWFKVHRPIYYYAAFFSKRAKEFDPEIFAAGRNAIRNKITELEERIAKKDALSNKETDLLGVLYIALEMVLRGYTFKQINIEKSLASDFVISEDKKSLYLPFIAVESLGETVAESIVEARNRHSFTSKADFEYRTSVNKKQYARLKTLGVLDELPDNDTLL